MNGAPLRLLLVSGSLPPMRCGVGDYTAGLARALVETGQVEAAVLTSRLEGRADAGRWGGFEVLEPIGRWRTRDLAPAMRAVRSWTPDIIHVQHPSQGYDGALPLLLGTAARWLLGVPLVVTLHEPVGVNLQVPAMAALIRSASALVVVRPNFRSQVNRKVLWTIAGRRLSLIPNATTLPRVTPTPEQVRAVRERFRAGTKALVAYFGFVYPSRGVHQLFSIADPALHHLVIVGGELDEAAPYFKEVSARARESDWRDSCTVTGFVPGERAAEILACADAVVLPFEGGGGSWNTSLHGARLQGTFVVTTSREARGYDARENVYYARPGDLNEMREALAAHLGKRREPLDVPTWEQVAAGHLEVYGGVRKARGT
jgi:glycosyltransferase involved in cell wall biosynthesis